MFSKLNKRGGQSGECERREEERERKKEEYKSNSNKTIT